MTVFKRREYGEIRLGVDADGRIIINDAPPFARISLALIQSSDERMVMIEGDLLLIGPDVAYRVIGWEGPSACLLVERVAVVHAGR